MDLGKFLSLLATRSLYFACPTQFADPYEGSFPRSHLAAEFAIVQNILDSYISQRDEFIARGMPAQSFDNQIQDMRRKLRQVHVDLNNKFGVCCWHEAEHESEAMWKLYTAAGQGIAIESTVGQLRSSVRLDPAPIIDRMRYADFDRDPIEKGHAHYRLFMKRQPFSHEKEVRATILLREPGQGIGVPCDLETLVTSVHISPLEPAFLHHAVEALCEDRITRLNKPVQRSKLYDPPNSELDQTAC